MLADHHFEQDISALLSGHSIFAWNQDDSLRQHFHDDENVIVFSDFSDGEIGNPIQGNVHPQSLGRFHRPKITIRLVRSHLDSLA